MKLVSRNCVRISFMDTWAETFAALERGNARQVSYFYELREKMSKSRKSKFDSYKDMYIDITEPSFQALGFDILEQMKLY